MDWDEERRAILPPAAPFTAEETSLASFALSVCQEAVDRPRDGRDFHDYLVVFPDDLAHRLRQALAAATGLAPQRQALLTGALLMFHALARPERADEPEPEF